MLSEAQKLGAIILFASLLGPVTWWVAIAFAKRLLRPKRVLTTRVTVGGNGDILIHVYGSGGRTLATYSLHPHSASSLEVGLRFAQEDLADLQTPKKPQLRLVR